jgi:periplasmic protein TonB
MTAATLDPRPRQWSLALAAALLLHLAVAMLYIQFADAGTWATGQGGIKVGLGPAGGAPGEPAGVSRPEEMQTAEAAAESLEVPPVEAAEILPAPVEVSPRVPETAALIPAEAVAAQAPEAARPALPETVPLYAPEVAAEAPPATEEVTGDIPEVIPNEAVEAVETVEVAEAVEAVETVETRRAMAMPPPPRAKPAAPLEEPSDADPPPDVAVVAEGPSESAATAAKPAVEAAPSGPAAGTAEAAESSGNRGKSGSGSTAASGNGQGDSGGGAAGSTADYKAMLLAWLERHKVYPRRARLRRQEGTAELYFVVDRQGQLLEYRLAKSSGHKLLDEEVTAMIERAAPLPAVPDDPQALRFVFNVPVSFDLR